MINKVSLTYSISVYTSVLNVQESKINYNVVTGLTALSRFDAVTPTEKYWSFSKNPKEIGKEYYRNGILHEKSLMSFTRDNKLYVSSGETQIGGLTAYIQPRSSIEVATLSSSGSAISLDGFWSREQEEVTDIRRKKALINFISSNVYKVDKGNYTLFAVPNEIDSYSSLPYMGYAFNEALDGLLVNNYLLKSGNFSSGLADNTSFSDLSLEDRNASLADGSFKAFCEYLGKGKESGYNSTFRLKYSPASEGYSTTPFEAGRTTILSRNKNTGTIRIYKTYNSYLEAETEAYDSEDGNACYFDRYTGKICFCRKSVLSSSQLVYTKPIGSEPGDNLPTFGNKYLHLNTDAFDDNGYIAIENGEEPTIVVPFWKLSKNKILIQTDITFPANCVISHYSYLNTVDSNEEVYAYYAPCIGLSAANGLGPAQHIEKTLDPWLWSNQKTIAVLGKNKTYPYKITLKAVGINYLRRGERTSTFVYGPLSNQNEIVYLEGKVLSESNDPIINQEVTVFIQEGKGLINGALSTSVITNDLGIFYATYSPGNSEFNWITFKAADVLVSGVNTFLSIPDGYELPISSDAAQKNILYMITKDDGSIGTTGIKYTMPPPTGVTSVDSELGVYCDPSGISSRILKTRQSLSQSWNAGESNTEYTKGIIFFDWLSKEEVNSYIGGKIILSMNNIEFSQVYKIRDILEIPEIWLPNPSDLKKLKSTFIVFADPTTPFINPVANYSNKPTVLVSSAWPNAKVMPTVNVQITVPIGGVPYEHGVNTTVTIGNNAGTNFAVGDVIKVEGNRLAGSIITNDLYLTVDEVTSPVFPGGSIVSFTTSYSGVAGDYKITSLRMIKPVDKMFDPTLMNGKKSVLARLKSTAESPTEWKHPSYDANSLSNPNPFQNVYGPVMTSSYSPGGRKFLISEILPSPNESDPNNPIAGYALIPETKASIIASTYGDNDNIIYSNRVEFEIELNNLNKGVIENLLKTVKIPYGWRLKGAGSEDASTIGVNTFFTINNIAASSKVGPAMPYVSYVNSNGINYLSNDLGVYENGSSEISFNIKL